MRRSGSRIALPALIGLAALPGCAPQARLAVAPEALSTEWRDAPAGASTEAVLPANLGAAFRSPALEALIARAKAHNADIGAAAARVAQARAQLAIARAAALPVIDASAGASVTRDTRARPAVYSFSPSFGPDLSYEVDLFGSAKAQRRAARGRFVAAAFDRDALELSVEADVARAFVQYATLTDRLQLLDRNLANARELERIISVRLREGDATKVDVGLQAIQVHQLETERSRLGEAQIQTRNALAVLVGEEAPLFALDNVSVATLAVPDIALVQPGALLVRRPDVRAAEARIRAAEGDVQQARAAFLPRLTLSASALGERAVAGGPVSVLLSAGAGLLVPIFNGGRLRGNLDVATAAQRETVELYRKALLTSFQEAEDAILSVKETGTRQTMLAAAAADARETARLARRQYLEGYTDLQELYNIETSATDAEDARVVAIQERLNAAIDLYKAMGGSAESGGAIAASSIRQPTQP